ncbi:MAG TPA: hypothetical protein VHK91_05250 [Flavisolibacter sp.]|jgi:hypothetical protein|nr:hypothetical protein [Flavisolibacter sp.]
MNEQVFLQTIQEKARELNMNPLLLLSGIEGIYTFKDVRLNQVNYEFLDSLILTIFALRIGDQFHTLAEENLMSTDERLRQAAAREMKELHPEDIAVTSSPYLQSFAAILQGKSVIRQYHEKALEAAALEIKRTQLQFSHDSIGNIIMAICKTQLQDSLNLGVLFS